MSGGAEADRLLRQFERDGVAACLVMAAAAVAIERGRLDGAVGVLAGGALMGLSYAAIKGGVRVVVSAAAAAGGHEEGAPATGEAVAGAGGEAGEEAAAPGGGGPAAKRAGVRRAWLAVKFVTRYALLAVMAYVMLACFHVHPIGLLAGASAPFVAAVALVVRSLTASAGRTRP